MRTRQVQDKIAEARHHLAQVRRAAEGAAERRRDITEDWRYASAGSRGKDAQRDDLLEVTNDATARIATETQHAVDDVAALEQEVAGDRDTWATPSPAALAAGERVRAMLAAGVHLKDVLTALRDDNDQPGLEWAHRSIGALVRAQVATTNPAAADSPEARTLVAEMGERLTDARWDAMGPSEQEYHQARRAVADLREAAERDRRYWTLVARGSATTSDTMAYGFATDPKWVEALSDSGTFEQPDGPVEAASEPVAVEA
jgi:hypothetical protein